MVLLTYFRPYMIYILVKVLNNYIKLLFILYTFNILLNMEKEKYNFYLLIYNIQSRHNIKELVKSALSFGCKKFLVLGKDKKVLNKYFEGENSRIDKIKNYFEEFEDIESLKKYIKENNITVCGVEIGLNCVPIQNHPFKGNTLFILGNEGAGLNKKQKDLCDQFVYIQQYSEKTGSLNVAIAPSIIFQHFSVWSGNLN